MNLKDLAGKYDAVFSLGENCSPAIQIQKNGLRAFSGPFDWLISNHSSDVNRLISSGFFKFMELGNLKINGIAPGDQDPPCLSVEDVPNRIVSVHDFPITHNSITELRTYTSFKEKMNRRIASFYEKAATCQKILYIRLNATYDDVHTLQSILRYITKNDFRLLIVNHKPDAAGIIDLHWPLENVISVVIPSDNVWSGKSWPELLKDVKLISSSSF